MDKPVLAGLRDGHALEVTFDGRLYTYSYTEVTQLRTTYAPDWAEFRTVRESVQNQLDESLHTYGVISCEVDPTGRQVLMSDRGRGVDFASILLLGETGKRSAAEIATGAVGTHGEGEIMSTMVATRLGLTKVMASQNWCVIGRIVKWKDTDRDVLGIDVYLTPTPRTGTAWYYAFPDAARQIALAYEGFVRHAAFDFQVHKTKAEGYGKQSVYDQLRATFATANVFMTERPASCRKKLIADEPGKLYSRGLYAGEADWDVALGYNVTLPRGRDGTLTWEQVHAEAEQLWTQADVDDVYAVFKWYGYRTHLPQEFRTDLGPKPSVVKAALKRYLENQGLRVLCWAVNGQDAAFVADASAMSDVAVVASYYQPPAWFQKIVPHVQTAVTVQAMSELNQPLPAPVRDFAAWIAAKVGLPDTTICGRTLAEGYDGGGNATRIILDPAHLPGWTWERFVEVVVHELAHVATHGAADCSRSHANSISSLSVKLMAAIYDCPTQFQALRMAFVTWSCGN